jgi:predicted metal-dependent peptidase
MDIKMLQGIYTGMFTVEHAAPDVVPLYLTEATPAASKSAYIYTDKQVKEMIDSVKNGKTTVLDLAKKVSKDCEDNGALKIMQGMFNIIPVQPELVNFINDKIGIDVEASVIGGKHRLLAVAPELARLLNRLTVKIVSFLDPDIKTMAVDDYGNIYISPIFSLDLTEEEFYGVFAHEAFHIINKTFLRKEWRNHTLWNLATDAVMNWYLASDKFKLPKGGIIPDVTTGEYIFPPPINEKITVLDNRGEILSCEDVYEQLEKIKKKSVDKDLKDSGNNKGKPGGAGKPGSGNSGEDTVEIQPGGTVTVNGKPVKGKLTPEMIDKILEQLDNKTDKHLTKEQAKRVNKDVIEEFDPEKQREREKEIENDLKRGDIETRASRTFGSNGGKVPATRKMIQRAIPPDPINWRALIKSYLQQASSKAYTWAKPSRRGMAAGVPLPGRGATAPNKLDAVFAIDTSGSIGSDQLSVFIHYVEKIAKQAEHLNVYVILWHHNAYYCSAPLATKGTLHNLLQKITKNTQPGGNDIGDINNLITAKNIKPTVCIYVTDGQEQESTAIKLRLAKYKKLFIIVNKFLDSNMVEYIERVLGSHGRAVFTPKLD